MNELSNDRKQKIDAHLKDAGEYFRKGDMINSENSRIQAWNLLPEPKLSWNYYSNIIPINSLRFYILNKNADMALKWLEITRESYGPNRNDTVEFEAAKFWYAMEDFDKAYEEFDRQYKSFKTRPFQGEDRKYLDFYLERKRTK